MQQVVSNELMVALTKAVDQCGLDDVHLYEMFAGIHPQHPGLLYNSENTLRAFVGTFLATNLTQDRLRQLRTAAKERTLEHDREHGVGLDRLTEVAAIYDGVEAIWEERHLAEYAGEVPFDDSLEGSETEGGAS
ncbi:MAG: hypothetical protein U0223_11670 [Nitrospira sp.]|nr:hypothetical protein [Nitrospira sp.]